MYRRHYRNPGPSRMPMLAWTRDLPIAGEPADVVEIVDSYSLAVEEPHPETVHRRRARGVPHCARKGNSAVAGRTSRWSRC